MGHGHEEHFLMEDYDGNTYGEENALSGTTLKAFSAEDKATELKILENLQADLQATIKNYTVKSRVKTMIASALFCSAIVGGASYSVADGQKDGRDTGRRNAQTVGGGIVLWLGGLTSLGMLGSSIMGLRDVIINKETYPPKMNALSEDVGNVIRSLKEIPPSTLLPDNVGGILKEFMECVVKNMNSTSKPTSPDISRYVNQITQWNVAPTQQLENANAAQAVAEAQIGESRV